MADAPVQGINIDPNLTVNAFNSGAATAFNYGAGAQADRASLIASRDAAANFNYGAGALEQQQATTENIDAGTATRLISNDVALYNFKQQRLDQEAVGNYSRQNKSLAAQQDLNRQEHASQFQASPAGQLGIARIAQLHAETELNKTEIGAKTAANQLSNLDLSQQSENAQLEINNVAVTRERDATLNRARITQQMHDALKADLTVRDQTGNTHPEQQAALISKLATADPQAFADAADIISDIGGKLDQQFNLPGNVRDSLSQAKRAATFVTSGNAIKSTMAGLSQARSQGQISSSGAAVLNQAATIGVNPNSADDVLAMQVEQRNGLYTLIGPDGRRSTPMSQEEFDQNPEMQNLFVQSEQRRRNFDNILNQGDRTQAVLKEVASQRYIPEVGASYTNLITNLAHEITDVPGFMTKNSLAVREYQQNLQSANPLFGPRSAELFKGTNIADNIVSRGINALQGAIGLPDADTRQLEQNLQRNPSLRRQIATAYQYRETGGMHPEVFMSTVNKIVANTAASDARYQVTTTNSAEAVRVLTEQLQATVIDSFQIPTNEIVLADLYNTVSRIDPSLAGQDTTIKTKDALGVMGGISRALRVTGMRITGADQGDLTKYRRVQQ